MKLMASGVTSLGPKPVPPVVNIKSGDEKGRRAMTASSIGIVTFGSAWIYRWKDDGEVVANCHKFPGSDFERRRMSVDEVSEALAAVPRTSGVGWQTSESRG